MSERETRVHEGWVDFVRVVAAFLVIVVHVTTHYFERFSPEFSFASWMAATAFASMARICVPLFLLLTGYLLLRPEISAFQFWRRRLRKLCVPWLFWSLVFIAYRCLHHKNQISAVSAVWLLLVDEVYYHLWFFYVMFGICPAIPFLAPLLKNGLQRLFQTACLFWCLTVVILPAAGRFLSDYTGTNCQIAIEVPVLTGFIGCPVLGVLLGQLDLTPVRIRLAIILMCSSMFTTFALTVWQCLRSEKAVETFFSYSDPAVVIASCAAFYLCRCIRATRVHGLSRIVAPLTLGVYLIHPLVLESVEQFVYGRFTNSLFGIPILTCVVMLTSLLIVRILKLTPVLRQTVAG